MQRAYLNEKNDFHQSVFDVGLEKVLDPLIREWNGLSPAQVRELRGRPLAMDPRTIVNYLGEERTPFGYEYVELELRHSESFSIRVRIEGEPGDLSTRAYAPVSHVQGDRQACGEWLRDTLSSIRTEDDGRFSQ